MSVSDGFIQHLKDQLSGLTAIRARRMFSGAGLYAGDTMFALVIDDVLYLKTDEASRADFEAEKLGPFTYSTRDRKVVTSYWRAPERLLDDVDEMRSWASRALAVARKSAQARKGARRQGRKAS